MAIVEQHQQHSGHRWMLEALKLAQNALDKQEVPSKCSNLIDRIIIFYLVGCVIVQNDSTIIASGQNEPVRLKNATRHAEICALDNLFAEHDLATAQKVSIHLFSIFV